MDISFYLETARRVISDPSVPANSVLIFDEISPDVAISVTYDDLGNPIVNNNKITRSLECWLRQAKPPDNVVQVGHNIDDEYFAGELVNPKTYPFPLKPNGAITVTINGRSGTFTPVNYFDSPAATVTGWNTQSYVGQKIAGWVQFKEGD